MDARATAFAGMTELGRRAEPSPLVRFWRRASRRRLAVIGLLIVLAVVLCALLAPAIAPKDPNAQELGDRLQPPFVTLRDGTSSYLGTDPLGRDILSRIIFGSRVSIAISALAVLVAGTAGIAVGLLAGFYRGVLDSILMRLVDLQLAFPLILLALAIIALLGPSIPNIVLVFAITSWPVYARTVRGSTLSLREKEFVEAARALGSGNGRILLRHLLPNVISPVTVIASFEMARMVILETALSFLGLGVPASIPSWGGMLADGRDYIRDVWWLAAFPGLAITFTVAGINFVGDGLRDVLDPRSGG